METVDIRISDVTAVVPSLNPDDNLLLVIEGLRRVGFSDIVVVNDGSSSAYDGFFARASEFPGVTLLTHPVNRGKGAAIKTALSYIKDNFPASSGAVTVDADNQHLPEDAASVAEAMLKRKESVFGARNFSEAGVPARSRFGNLTTSAVLLIFCGIRITDTQTGLRAFPREIFDFLCGVEGDRYEYETNMILEMKSAGHGFSESAISTVYLNENKGSHFHVIRDSMRIYALILKFAASSLISFLADYLLFLLLMLFLPRLIADEWWRIAAATATARLFSSVLNFFINKRGVFKSDSSVPMTLLKYYCLAIPQMCLSALLVYGITSLLGVLGGFTTSIVKVVVDIILFMLSFRIQKGWVFR